MRSRLVMFSWVVLLPLVNAFRHLVLIGMPGVGKSFLGNYASTILSLPFVDTDHQLLIKGISPPDDPGDRLAWSLFRKAESELLEQQLLAHGPSIISTGGGVVDCHRSFHLLMNHRDGVVHIMRSGASPFEVPGGIDHRRLPDNRQKLWEKRARYYMQASGDSYWNENDRKPEEFVSWLIRHDLVPQLETDHV